MTLLFLRHPQDVRARGPIMIISQHHGGAAHGVGDSIIIGILTASDRASSGEYEDQSGPAILEFFSEAIHSPWTAIRCLVPDEQHLIESSLINLVDTEGCSLVVTTGGTGPTPRDVTPEATVAVCSRMLPGFSEQMRRISLRHVPTAVLSRQMSGIRSSSLIINLPGRPRAIRETIDEIFPAVPYCIDLIGGPYIETNASICEAFRPPGATRSPQST